LPDNGQGLEKQRRAAILALMRAAHPVDVLETPDRSKRSTNSEMPESLSGVARPIVPPVRNNFFLHAIIWSIERRYYQMMGE
jgi:hypothetical protein